MNLKSLALFLLNYFISVIHYKCTANLQSDKAISRESTGLIYVNLMLVSDIRLQRKEAVHLQSEQTSTKEILNCKY